MVFLTLSLRQLLKGRKAEYFLDIFFLLLVGAALLEFIK
jgi:hypothetical protein